MIGGMLAATLLAILFVPLFFRLMTRERPAAQASKPVPAPMASAADS